MKIALVTEYFYPNSKGGTEKYVYQQAKKLIEAGNVVVVITISENGVTSFKYDEIEVHTINHENGGEKQIISGQKPSKNIIEFENLLKKLSPDTVHFHTLTPSFGIFHIEIAKQLNCKILFTAHTPSITCIRGDLMQYGAYACDGKIEKQKCLSCFCNKKGVPKFFSPATAKILLSFRYPNHITKVVDYKYNTLNKLNSLCDALYVFTKWQEKVFIENGFDPSKLIVTTQMQVPLKTKTKVKVNEGKLKIGFIGRIAKEKGLHVLVKALKNINNSNIELHIAGIPPSARDKYFMQLKGITENVKNIFWQYNLNEDELKDFYKKIDLLCIPSIWYETGPFVLYEALQNNIPIIANDLGDMREWKIKGFDVNLYHDLNGLEQLIKSTL